MVKSIETRWKCVGNNSREAPILVKLRQYICVGVDSTPPISIRAQSI